MNGGQKKRHQSLMFQARSDMKDLQYSVPLLMSSARMCMMAPSEISNQRVQILESFMVDVK